MNSNHLPANWDLARGLEGLGDGLALVQAQEARLAQAYRVGLLRKTRGTFLRIGLRKGTPSSVGRREHNICHGSPADNSFDRTLHTDSCRHPHEVSCRRCA
jgi:hypothetical protein